MQDKKELIDAPERRGIPSAQFELRSTRDSLHFSGYASVFDKGYDLYGGPPIGWTEYIERGAFDKTLKEGPDLHLLINHDGLPLARTKSGTLHLSVDDTGLRVDADLDRRDPDVQRLQTKMERGDIDEMSFAFRVKRQSWSADETERRLEEVSLHKGDVSVVNFGANPHTSASLRSALNFLASSEIRLSEGELDELRGNPQKLARAMSLLNSLSDTFRKQQLQLQNPEVHVFDRDGGFRRDFDDATRIYGEDPTAVQELSAFGNEEFVVQRALPADAVANGRGDVPGRAIIRREAVGPPPPQAHIVGSSRAGKSRLTRAELRALIEGAADI
jgi:HK97 family phage prohead protease